MGLSIVAVFMMAGSMSTSQIVAAQANGREVALFGLEFTAPGWYAILLAPSFVIYAISAVGETNRARSTCPRRSPSWSAASTRSTRRSSSRCSSWPSTST